MVGTLPDKAAAKARLGIRTAARDAEIESLVAAAIEHVEDLTGHLLKRRTYAQSGRSFAGGDPVTLHAFPVHALVSVSTLDAGAEVVPLEGPVLMPGGDAYPARVFPGAGSAWPSSPFGYTIEVDAGYPDGEVPEQLIQAVLLLVGHWFENHEAVVVGTSAVELPIGVRDLCRNFRAPGFE